MGGLVWKEERSILERLAAALSSPPPHGYDAQTAPPDLRPIYNTLSANPDTEYGTLLPFARNREGSASWVQEGANTRMALPSAVREGLFGTTDLLAGVDTGQVTPRAAQTLAFGGMGAGGMAAPRGALASGGAPPIRGWHGSPHDFPAAPGKPLGQFLDSKIGTGEGHQAYSRGHYIGGKELVGRAYRDSLSPPVRMIGDQVYDSANPEHLASHLTRTFSRRGPEEGRAAATRMLGNDVSNPALTDEKRALYASALSILESGRALPESLRKSAGKMYEVDIHADPAKFLDWDKKLTDQTSFVKSALSDFSTPLATLPLRLQPSGQTIVRAFKEGQLPLTRRGETSAPSTLLERGIPGVRYLDAGSRGAGVGTSNYVVYDPATIEILRKYGMAVPAPVAVPSSEEIDTRPRAVLSRIMDEQAVR